MHLTYQPLTLPLEFTFTISRSAKTKAHTLLVTLTHQQEGQAYTGLGEAVPSEFYDETPDTVTAFYDQLIQNNTLTNLNPFNLQALENTLSQYPGNHAAKSAIDIACYDLQGKLLGIPLYQLWGLDPTNAPKTSYTIGLADLDTVKHKTQTALSRGYDILKVKLGGDPDNDKASLHLIRQLAPEATIRIDANAAWTLDEAFTWLDTLQALNIEFVEEPLRLDVSDDACRTLKEKTPLPLMADERCHRLTDIPKCAELFHSINLKHTKTGGLSEAKRMIHAAQAHGLKVMLGGFCESSVSVTAMAHLSPLADYADLDANLLLANDPYLGVRYQGSQIVLPSDPGLGVRLK